MKNGHNVTQRFSRLAIAMVSMMPGLTAERLHAAPLEGAVMQSAPESTLAEKTRAALLAALQGERDFVRIHAGEALASLGEKALAHRAFLEESEVGEVRYRIGVWRVLAMSAPSEDSAADWIRRIEEIVEHPTDPSLLLAVESLNKLGVRLSAGRRSALKTARAEIPKAGWVFLDWAEHLAGEADALPRIIAALDSPLPAARARAAYVLRQIPERSAEARERLAVAARREPAGSMTRVFVLSAAVALEVSSTETPVWTEELERVLESGPDAARYQSAQLFAERYDRDDLPRLETLLAAAQGDARVGLAWAILRILGR